MRHENTRRLPRRQDAGPERPPPAGHVRLRLLPHQHAISVGGREYVADHEATVTVPLAAEAECRRHGLVPIGRSVDFAAFWDTLEEGVAWIRRAPPAVVGRRDANSATVYFPTHPTVRAHDVSVCPELAESVTAFVNAIVTTCRRRRTPDVADLFRDVLTAAVAATPAGWQKTGKARADFRRRLERLRAALADTTPRRGRPRSLRQAAAALAEAEPLGPTRAARIAPEDERVSLESLAADLAALSAPARAELHRALRRVHRRGRPVPPGHPWFFRRFDPLLRPGAIERLSPAERHAWAAGVDVALATLPMPSHRPADDRESALIRCLAETARHYTGRPLDRAAGGVFAAVTGARGLTPGTYQCRRDRLERAT